ncbi:trypsin alpha-like [Culicoides brevitarsis]|uniref:trypsin alpha-like n=1 Tax=Culicoides brevitarsis TaxID=469753 RepID=UPI00307C2A73
MVSIQENDKHICGGSILSKNRILTAADCVVGKELMTLNVKYGFRKGIEPKIAEIDKIARSNCLLKYYDIAVLKLKTNMIDEENGEKIIREVSIEEHNDDEARVFGWGKQQDISESNLETADVTLENSLLTSTCLYLSIHHTLVAPYASLNPDTVICGASNAEGICNTDVGGPAMTDNYLSAVAVSGSDFCGGRAVYIAPYNHYLENFVKTALLD